MISMTGIVIGLIIGAVWMRVMVLEKLQQAKEYRAKSKELQEQLEIEKKASQTCRDENIKLQNENIKLQTQLASEKEMSQTYRQQWDRLDNYLKEEFKIISTDVLSSNTRSFIGLVEDSMKRSRDETKTELENQQDVLKKLMDPLKADLGEFTSQVKQLELNRQKNDATFKEQVSTLVSKTDKLTHIFSNPIQRGRWGELQLRRIVEMVGLLEHVDFEVQTSEGDTRRRPDMIVRLPNNRCVIVDAKAPQFEDCLSSVQENPSEEDQKKILKDYFQRIRNMISDLSKKNYCLSEPSPDFVVLFFPGEWIFSRALQIDEALIEYGYQNNVLFATPTTLIALLKSVHYGWQQNEMTQKTKEVISLGRELCERMSKFSEHFEGLRKNLSGACECYNKALSSWEKRMLPTAEKIRIYAKQNIEFHFQAPLEVELRTPSVSPVQETPSSVG